ncbi:hypothetical protein NRIC_26360 [Enterococcus florum]|uniref:Mga helix-turn-helix domain-containing protein n=1 Tax=Enterococcus florum TaxID=2480627 RepID=A0A4P5P9I1_9ENTE|nr:helix-turn-helix domain-containing protein [Enterococcus florum]GCF94745.1 hypothetical protein NRIC_26360 [Enterococcus florum]
MLFGEFLLTKQQQKKIAFFKQMEELAAGDYSVHALSQRFHYPYLSFLSLLEELNDTLLTLNEEPILVGNSIVKWASNPSRFNNFMLEQLKQSTAYQFLLTSLFYPEKCLADFSREHYISKSTVLRRLQPLSGYFNSCGIKINVSGMTLLGNESTIRLLYIAIIWNASLGGDIYQYGRSFEAEQALVEALADELPGYTHPKLFLLMLAVCRVRNEQNKLLEPSPFDDLSFSQTRTKLVNYLSEFLVSPQRISHNQEFINYLIYFYPYCIACPSHLNEPMEEYYQENLNRRHPLFVAINDFYTFVIEDVLPPMEDPLKKTLQHSITRVFLNYWIQQKQIPLFFESIRRHSFEQTALYHSIRPIVQKVIKKISRRKDLKWMSGVNQSLTNMLCLTLIPFFSCSETSIRVGLISSSNFFHLQHVVAFLRNICFVEIVLYPKADEEVDLYITTFKELLPTQDKPYFLVSVLNRDYEADLPPLLFEIQAKKVHKMKHGCDKSL